MPIESQCTGCGKRLRVADEFAGRRARCPVCHTVYTVPSDTGESWSHVEVSESANSTDWNESADDSWYLRAHDGQVYGPVVREELEKWVVDGRVDAKCQLRNDGDLGWVSADVVFPVLNPGRGADFDAQTLAAASFRQTTDEKGDPYPVYVVPHRGPLILILGICSWFFSFPVFGVIAWIMGSRDLREIRGGQRDPQGESLTRAGQLLGMVHVLLFAAIFASLLLFLMLVLFGGMM